MKKKLNSEKAPAALGPYSQAIETEKTIFLSGQLGIDASTAKLEEGIEAQTHRAMKNIGVVLAEAGCDYSNIVKTTIFLQNLADFATMNEIYKSYLSEPYPARSCVQVAKLPLGALVEIECVALKN